MTATLHHPVTLTDVCACNHILKDHGTRHCFGTGTNGCTCTGFHDGHPAEPREHHPVVGLVEATIAVLEVLRVVGPLATYAAGGTTISLGFDYREDEQDAITTLGLDALGIPSLPALVAHIGRTWRVVTTVVGGAR